MMRSALLSAFCVVLHVSGGEAFKWGTATAAYQVEGFRNASGRQTSVWDCFDTPIEGCPLKYTRPNGDTNVFEAENAATADQDYVKYNESIASLKDHSLGAFRLSISWPRVLSYTKNADGTLSVADNKEGIEHYHKVLDAFNAAGISVSLTMWHWDTPAALEDYALHNSQCMVEGAGTTTGSAWLCPDIADFFEHYAALLVREYGQKVDNWITLNEPYTLIGVGYTGAHAPGRCKDRSRCWDGNEDIEPFHVTHNLLRAHAKAFNVWKASKNTRASSKCGITLNGDFGMPLTDSDKDKAAAVRFMEYQMAIFFDPIYYGKWPQSVVDGVGPHLPALDAALIYGTHAGVYFQNHYTTQYAWDDPTSFSRGGVMGPANVSTSGYKDGVPIGTPSSNGWLFSYGPGLGLNQAWLHERYPDVSFYVTENGWGNVTTDLETERHDLVRCNYYRTYIGGMGAMMAEKGYKVLGYFAWSLVDNYEWADGYSTRFGLTYVNYETQVRTPKDSLLWLKKVAEMFPDGPPANGVDALPQCGQ